MNQQDWIADRKHVLESLRRFEDKMDLLSGQMAEMKADVHLLKYKSGLWGALAGALAFAAARWFGKA